jgi:hypothetical protein
MKKSITFLLVMFLIAASNVMAQDVTTVEATSSDISDNLDLEAVASIFGESEDLEDFEKRLNDPETQISNLDLNEDGEVDYLRVVSNSEGDAHLITIQAVLGKDIFQDVATIDVDKDDKGETKVQVVGDVYMYGENYIVEPVYVSPPVMYVYFYSPHYHPWRSPYYWGYYPPYYRPWHPYPPHRYRSNVHVHVNVHNSYHRTNVRYSRNTVNIHNRTRRNDYGSKHPNRSFNKRNPGVSNRSSMVKSRPANNTRPSAGKPTAGKPSTGKSVKKDWKPASGNNNVKNNKVTKPTTRPASKPSSTPSTRPASKPSSTPSTRPASKPSSTPSTTRPASKPASKPAARPASRPSRRK